MPYATPRSKSPASNAPRIDMRGVKTDKNIETTIGRKIERQPDGCWLWTGALNNTGYAMYRGINGPVHRFVYQTLVGEIPDKHDLHHECEVRHCVNPLHLVPLTRSEHQQLYAGLRRAR